jgi:site-specific recombinase XerD
MEQSTKLDHLIETLLSEIRKYGISQVSMEQYQVVCNSILKFATKKEVETFSDELIVEYTKMVKRRCDEEDICPEYLRFQKRVIRMLKSLAFTGNVDFSVAKSRKKYKVSGETAYLVANILDENKLAGEARFEMDIVLRHFFFYARYHKIPIDDISDEFFMEFLTSEMPITNHGSIGRSLRGIKYISSYLKSHGRSDLKLDFNQLKIKTGSVKMIPPYSQNEITKILEAVDRTTPEGLRDYAILLLGFDTGLRGVDIRKLCLSDIDWKVGKVKIRQCKTSEPLVLPLSGRVMNAIADYILKGRHECGYKEIFLNIKKPVRPMDKRYYPFTGIITKYSMKADVELKPMRGFHSLRRSFATELSMAGVPLESISQLLGHKTIDEDKPYLSYNREQIAFCSMGFFEIPLENGLYASVSPAGGDCHDLP